MAKNLPTARHLKDSLSDDRGKRGEGGECRECRE